jgi:hypothetical protein
MGGVRRPGARGGQRRRAGTGGANAAAVRPREAEAVPIGAPPIYPHDLLGSMQKPRSENRLQPSWDYRGLSKPAKAVPLGAAN